MHPFSKCSHIGEKEVKREGEKCLSIFAQGPLRRQPDESLCPTTLFSLLLVCVLIRGWGLCCVNASRCSLVWASPWAVIDVGRITACTGATVSFRAAKRAQSINVKTWPVVKQTKVSCFLLDQSPNVDIVFMSGTVKPLNPTVQLLAHSDAEGIVYLQR